MTVFKHKVIFTSCTAERKHDCADAAFHLDQNQKHTFKLSLKLKHIKINVAPLVTGIKCPVIGTYLSVLKTY